MKHPIEQKKLFLIFTVTFLVAIGSVASFFFSVERELKETSKAKVSLERVRMLVERSLLFIEREKDQSHLSSKTEGELKKMGKSTVSLIESIKNSSSLNWGRYSNVRKLYSDRRWKIGENVHHFVNQLNLLREKGKADWLKEDPARFQLLHSNGELLITSLGPVVDLLVERENEIKFWAQIAMSSLFLGFTFLCIFLYQKVFLPWRGEFISLARERERLGELVRMTEEKGESYFWEMDVKTKKIQRSNYLSGLFEIDQDEVGDEFFYDELSLIEEASREQFIAEIDEVIANEGSFEIEVSILTKNKKRHWLLYSGRFAYDEYGPKIVAVVYDTTQKRLSELRFEKLFYSDDKPRFILEENEIWNCNDNALKFLGYDEKDSLVKLHPSLLSPMYQVDGESSMKRLKEIFSNVQESKVCQSTWTFKRIEGDEISAEIEIMTLNYEERDYYLMTVTENHLRYEYERRLIDANRRSMESFRKRTEYSTKINFKVQELISEALNICYSDVLSEEKGQGNIDKVLKGLESIWAQNINEDVGELGGTIIFDIEQNLDVLENRWRSAAESKDIQFSLVKKETLDKQFWGDLQKINFVLNTLVENAIKHTPEGSVEIEVDIESLTYRRDRYHFKIKDTGIGIEQAEIEDILSHQRESETALLIGGSSINLKGVMNCVELIQGDLKFETNDEKGVSFIFSIELEKVIEEGQLSVGRVSLVGQPSEDSFSMLDVSIMDIWSHFGGDWSVVQSVIKDFLDYYPVAIDEISTAIKDRDSVSLHNSASGLYGVLAHFPFGNTLEKVITLQKMGEYSNFDGAFDQLFELKKALEEVDDKLARLITDQEAA